MTDYILLLVIGTTGIAFSRSLYLLVDYWFDDCDIFATWDD